jgi:hypothetical protein
VSPRPGPAVLSGGDIAAVTGLLRLIGGWLEAADPAVRHDLDAYLRRHPARLSASDLPARIAWAAAMIRYRQSTTAGTR